jgi:trimethylamine:corrinoid methyltransferase-like protein
MRRKKIRDQKARTAVEYGAPADVGLHAGPTAPYDPLPAADAQRLIDTTFELMRDVGVGFEPDPEVMSLFSEAGCSVSSKGLVKFDPKLVKQAIASVAKSVKLWNRSGSEFIEIDNRHTWFVSGMTAIQVLDLESGESRSSTRDDLVTITRVADALPNIDAVCMGCKNVERSDILGEIDEFVALVENTSKPLEYLCENAASLEVVIEMAAAVRGGRDALAEKPYFMQVVTPLPLYYAKAHTDQIITAVKAGIPVATGTVTIAGASAPITMAGCLTHCLATDLAAVVLAQLVRQGAFCIGGSDACYMEPATGGRGGFPQVSLSDMAACQICRVLGIPSMTGVGGKARSRRFNQDAVFEITANMTQTFHSRPANCDYMGLMDEGMTYSLHALLYANELAGLNRRMWRGLRVDDDTLAMELTRQEGPRGNYLAHPHTSKFCRTEIWDTHYFGAKQPLSTSVLPDLDLFERIDAELREILADHLPEPLSESIRSEIASIQRSFAESYREIAI